MAEDDDIITIGDAFPRIEAVFALEQFHVLVKWTGGRQVVVDLGPNICSMKHYAPLREDRALFETVHLANASTIAWGTDDDIDMHVSEVERLEGERMDATSFKAWLRELDLTRDSAAALLGMSKRMVNYYASGSDIPRYVALACAQLVTLRRQQNPRLFDPLEVVMAKAMNPGNIDLDAISRLQHVGKLHSDLMMMDRLRETPSATVKPAISPSRSTKAKSSAAPKR